MHDDDAAGATVVDLADLPRLDGRHVATSGWCETTQDRIDAFAEATGSGSMSIPSVPGPKRRSGRPSPTDS